jgi:uncharacterized SAM-binding protein YcdF (DUF218 family)
MARLEPKLEAPALGRAERVVLVFGCPVGPDNLPTPALERRLNRALSEGVSDPAVTFLVSGGRVRGQTEAHVMKAWLMAHGIGVERILEESIARDTEENAAFSAEVLRHHSPERITLVTDRFHMRRSRILLRWALHRTLKKQVTVVAAPAQDNKRGREHVWLVIREAWGLLWSVGQVVWRRLLQADSRPIDDS